MSGNKPVSSIANPVKLVLIGAISSASTSYQFVADEAGRYQFVLFGRGGNSGSSAGGGSGALVIHTVRLSKSDTVALVVAGVGGVSPDSSATFPGGMVLTAGNGGAGSSGTPGIAGVASGGDVNLNGAVGGTGGIFPGATAPSYGGFIGGTARETPGGGGTAQAGQTQGAPGEVVVIYLGQ